MGRFVFRLPDIGEGVTEAEIAEWHVKVGDHVDEDQPLVDVLTDKGFEYDSSVYPVHHPRYGIPSFARVPRRVRTPIGNVIREFPLTTLRIFGRNVGASGGGYLRILPLAVLETSGSGHVEPLGVLLVVLAGA